MPSHHFEGKERNPEVPPWGLDSIAETNNQGTKGGLLTTNQWIYRGLKGSPAKPVRNGTTNHFDPQNWRNKSSYRETFFTPQMYSRHQMDRPSPFRNHRPHPKELIWPLEPNKEKGASQDVDVKNQAYAIWNPKTLRDLSLSYSAPSLLRHHHGRKSNLHTTYQDHFERLKKQGSRTAWSRNNDTREGTKEQQRSIGTRDNESRETRDKQRPATEGYKMPLNMATQYRKIYNGEPGRPSTDARPIDYSWRNIRY